MINYYESIDYLEFESQLNFISKSIEIIGINESIGSRISSIFKGIGSFIVKIKDWISGCINRIFNKEQVKYTVMEKQADNIISKSKGGEIPIKEEIKPKVAEKINNMTEQIKNSGSESDTPKQTEKPKPEDNKTDNTSKTVKDVSDKYKDTPKQTEKPKPEDNKTDNTSKTVKDVSDKYKDTPKQTEKPKPEDKPIRTNKTKYSVNIIFRNTKRFEECLSIKDTIENIIIKSIDFININYADILKGGEMEKMNKFKKDNNISDTIKKIDKLKNPTSNADIWEYAHFDNVNDIKIVSIIKNRIRVLKKLNINMGNSLHTLDKNFNKLRDIVRKLEKEMDAKYGRYEDIPKNDRDDIYAVVDVFTEIRFRTRDYINTTKLFLTNINSETDNLWKMISIIKSGIAPIEKEPEAVQLFNDKNRGVDPQHYAKHQK